MVVVLVSCFEICLLIFWEAHVSSRILAMGRINMNPKQIKTDGKLTSIHERFCIRKKKCPNLYCIMNSKIKRNIGLDSHRVEQNNSVYSLSSLHTDPCKNSSFT